MRPKAAVHAVTQAAAAATATAPPEEEAKSGSPDESWTKASIQEWLDEEDIAWTTTMTKGDLLELVP